jgi:hypothetical protein
MVDIARLDFAQTRLYECIQHCLAVVDHGISLWSFRQHTSELAELTKTLLLVNGIFACTFNSKLNVEERTNALIELIQPVDWQQTIEAFKCFRNDKADERQTMRRQRCCFRTYMVAYLQMQLPRCTSQAQPHIQKAVAELEKVDTTVNLTGSLYTDDEENPLVN